jgi:hypothetical protein
VKTSLILTLGALCVLSLVWLGYPLGIRLWAWISPNPIRPDYESGSHRLVTIVLATRESAAAITERVANLLDSEHPAENLRVVVTLDREGAKATPADLGALPACASVVIGDAPGGKACTLNAGVRAASGDVLVMADTAQRFNRHTIPELVAHLEDERFGAVSGALDLDGGHSWSPVGLYWRVEKWLRYHEAVVHSSVGVTGAVYATRRRCWPVIPAGALLDDVYVPMALVLSGWRIGFARHAYARDTRAFNAAAESQRKSRTLTGVLQLHSLLPQVLGPNNPVRTQYVLHKLARLTTPVWGIVGAIGAAGLAVQLGISFPRETGGVAATLLLLVLLSPRLRRAVTYGTSWVVGMQLAILRAMRNGLQKRWRVW